MKILLLLLVLVSASVVAQVKLPTNDFGQVQYQELIRLPDATRPARLLMVQTHSWIEQYYPTEGDVEQQYDQEHNIAFLKAAYSIDNQSVRYTLTIEVKMGRYRATITDLVADNNGLSLPVQPSSPTAEEMTQASDGKLKNPAVINQAVAQQADLYRQIDKECRATLASLKASLLKKGD